MEKLKAAAVSTRNLIGEMDTNIEDMRRWAEKTAKDDVELMLFPELNVCGHAPSPAAAQLAEPVPGPSTEKIIRIARSTEQVIAFGILEREASRIFCTHVLVNGEGIIGKQRKIHVPAQERPFWEAGNSIEVFDIGKAKVGITICRDSFFDEMTRTLYFKGAEILLMPFGYYNVPRSKYLRETIHGMSIVKAAWTNGCYVTACNSAGEREPSEWEPQGRKFPGWAGIIDPWGSVITQVDSEGNGEAASIAELSPELLADRRNHPNFLAQELRPDLYRFTPEH